MKSENESKEIDIKNCVCYYFDDIINGTKINFSNILLDKKFQLKMFVYKISNKTPTGPKPFCIRFNNIDELLYLLTVKLNI